MAKQTVDQFMKDLSMQNSDIYELMEKIRKLVNKLLSNITEEIKYGGIMFSIDGVSFGGIFPYANHVSFEFSGGAGMEDKPGLLRGNGKRRRHLKIENTLDLENCDLSYYLGQVR